MEKGINLIYNDLETTIVGAMNRSGLPICCIKDILQGLYLEARQKYAYQVQVERQARKAAESAAAQPAEPEAATAETAPTGKEAPHA